MVEVPGAKWGQVDVSYRISLRHDVAGRETVILAINTMAAMYPNAGLEARQPDEFLDNAVEPEFDPFDYVDYAMWALEQIDHMAKYFPQPAGELYKFVFMRHGHDGDFYPDHEEDKDN